MAGKKLSAVEVNEAANIVVMFSYLVHAWKTNNFREAARVLDELEEEGVSVKILRRRPRTKERTQRCPTKDF